MINEILLVGRIKEMGEIDSNKQILKLEVERPFDDRDGRVYDVFTCKLWYSIFSKIISICTLGDMLAIRGRMVNENEIFFVMAEKVVLINKSKQSILKETQI